MLAKTIGVVAATTGLMLGTISIGGAMSTYAALTASQPASQSTKLCGSNQHLVVHNRIAANLVARQYQIRNAFWLGQRPQCITNTRHLTNFTVTQRAGFDRGGRVIAYPDIFRGCIWHICSPKAGIPIEVSHIKHPALTWHTRENATGTWNAAYDIWFGKKRMITGQADGAELMIWLNEHGRCCALQRGAPKVRVGHHAYRLSHWRATHNGFSWNYIQFRMIHRTWRADNLRLRPFIRKIARMGLIKRTWWMENVEAGFEIWSGGQGLRTTMFRVRM